MASFPGQPKNTTPRSNLLYVDKLDVVGEFRSHLERRVAGGTSMRPIGAVIFEVSAQTAAGCIHARTQRTSETQHTCSTN